MVGLRQTQVIFEMCRLKCFLIDFSGLKWIVWTSWQGWKAVVRWRSYQLMAAYLLRFYWKTWTKIDSKYTRTLKLTDGKLGATFWLLILEALPFWWKGPIKRKFIAAFLRTKMLTLHFLAPSGAQGVTMCVRSFVRPIQTCLESLNLHQSGSGLS